MRQIRFKSKPIRFDAMQEIPFAGQRMDICKSTHTHTHALTHTQSLLPLPLQIKTADTIFANQQSEEWETVGGQWRRG